MKPKIQNLTLGLALLTLSTLDSQLSTAHAQTTAITFQGQLNSGGGNANGVYDLRFAVYDANVAGNFIAGPVTNSAVAVSNGLFTVQLDFGPGVFTGTNYWVEMGVRTNGGAGFATLAPRQALTPTPYALSLPSPQMNALCPVGSVMAFAGATPPPGWLPCNGTNVSRTTYSNLFLVINTTYGIGDGSSTFTLPDMRGRTAVGQGTGPTLSNRTLGQTLGEETHTLTSAEMPSHTHSASDGSGHSHGIQGGALLSQSGSSYGVIGSSGPTRSSTDHVSITIGSTGGNGSAVTVPHNVMQPSLVLNSIIKY